MRGHGQVARAHAANVREHARERRADPEPRGDHGREQEQEDVDRERARDAASRGGEVAFDVGGRSYEHEVRAACVGAERQTQLGRAVIGVEAARDRARRVEVGSVRAREHPILGVEHHHVDGGVETIERVERVVHVLGLSIAERVLERDLEAPPQHAQLALHRVVEVVAFGRELPRAARAEEREGHHRERDGESGGEGEVLQDPTRVLQSATHDAGDGFVLGARVAAARTRAADSTADTTAGTHGAASHEPCEPTSSFAASFSTSNFASLSASPSR